MLQQINFINLLKRYLLSCSSICITSVVVFFLSSFIISSGSYFNNMQCVKELKNQNMCLKVYIACLTKSYKTKFNECKLRMEQRFLFRYARTIWRQVDLIHQATFDETVRRHNFLYLPTNVQGPACLILDLFLLLIHYC